MTIHRSTKTVSIFCLVFSLFTGSTFIFAQTNITANIQVIIKSACMGYAVSNELVKVSQNMTLQPNLQLLASTALQNFNKSGTNTLEEISTFYKNWPLPPVEPVMSPDVIALMQATMEFGVSSENLLKGYISNTNNPAAHVNLASNILLRIYNGTIK